MGLITHTSAGVIDPGDTATTSLNAAGSSGVDIQYNLVLVTDGS